MKRFMLATAMVLCAASGAFAAAGTWTGKISDSMCGLSHKAMIAQSGHKTTNAQCTEACVKGGAKYVFTSGGKVFSIANQDEKDLSVYAGKNVRLAGDLEGTTITVSKMSKPAKAPAKKR